jgi:DNA-binding MarR family transcriptional regulator
MRLTTPLDDLFKTGSHVKVLRALHAFPEGAASSGRDLARRAGVSHPTAINVLEHLSEQGVVEVERSSNSYRYRLNGRHLLYSGLARLFAMESEALAGLVEFLADEIATRAGSVTAAYLYGSAARSDMSLRERARRSRRPWTRSETPSKNGTATP